VTVTGNTVALYVHAWMVDWTCVVIRYQTVNCRLRGDSRPCARAAYTDSRVAVCCEFCSHNVSDVTDTCGVAWKLGPFAGSNLCTKVGKTVRDETSRKCEHLWDLLPGGENILGPFGLRRTWSWHVFCLVSYVPCFVVPLPYVASICPAISVLTLCKQSALYCVTCSGSMICFWVRSSVPFCSHVCRS